MKKVILLMCCSLAFITSCKKSNDRQMIAEQKEVEIISNALGEDIGAASTLPFIIRTNADSQTQMIYTNFMNDSTCSYTVIESYSTVYNSEIKFSESFLEKVRIKSISDEFIECVYNNMIINLSTNYNTLTEKLTITYNDESIVISNLSNNEYFNMLDNSNNPDEIQPIGWPVIVGVILLTAEAIDKYCDYQQWSQANALTRSGCKKVIFNWCGAVCEEK